MPENTDVVRGAGVHPAVLQAVRRIPPLLRAEAVRRGAGSPHDGGHGPSLLFAPRCDELRGNPSPSVGRARPMIESMASSLAGDPDWASGQFQSRLVTGGNPFQT
jgi:hypothetical protein